MFIEIVKFLSVSQGTVSVSVNVLVLIEASVATRLLKKTDTEAWNWKFVGKVIDSTAPAGIAFVDVKFSESFVGEFSSIEPI